MTLPISGEVHGLAVTRVGGGELALAPVLNPSLTFQDRTSTCGESQGSADMPETPLWDKLTRSEQRLLIRLFGGGGANSVETRLAASQTAEGAGSVA